LTKTNQFVKIFLAFLGFFRLLKGIVMLVAPDRNYRLVFNSFIDLFFKRKLINLQIDLFTNTAIPRANSWIYDFKLAGNSILLNRWNYEWNNRKLIAKHPEVTFDFNEHKKFRGYLVHNEESLFFAEKFPHVFKLPKKGGIVSVTPIIWFSGFEVEEKVKLYLRDEHNWMTEGF